jgi:hypothetical protein
MDNTVRAAVTVIGKRDRVGATGFRAGNNKPVNVTQRDGARMILKVIDELFTTRENEYGDQQESGHGKTEFHLHKNGLMLKKGVK